MFLSSLGKYLYTNSPNRYIGLDILRALAVVGVILRHSNTTLPFTSSGWAGVDLFFVLSGFLVTGLLITEYKEQQDINRSRFFIRRSFKILPPFYMFLLVGILYNYLANDSIPGIKQLIIEFGFLQSYYDGLWLHTWTLAVEEQFYLFLLLLFSLLIFFKALQKPHIALLLLTALLLTVWTSRILFSLKHREEELLAMFTTHTRSDGLLVGAICAFLYHYYPSFKATIRNNRIGSGLIATACITPIFIYPGGSFPMNTWGLCLLHIGFALVVILSLDIKISIINAGSWIKRLMQMLASIGFHSYSIYLWHIIIRNLCYSYLPSGRVAVWSYFMLSVVVGIIMSILIEQQFLVLRDKLFPGIKKSAVAPKPLTLVTQQSLIDHRQINA